MTRLDVEWSARPVTIAIVAIALLLGSSLAGLVASEISPSGVLIFAVALVLALPLANRVRQGRFDILEPIVWLSGALGLMFVIRPSMLLLYDKFMFRRVYDIRPTFDDALVVALIGVIGLQIGYHLRFGRALGGTISPLPDRTSDSRILFFAMAFAVISAVSFLRFTRSGDTGSLIGGIAPGSASTSAYQYMAPFLIVPAMLLLIRTGVRTRTKVFILAAVVVMALFAMVLLPGGARLNALVSLTGFAIYPMLRSKWRPSAVSVVFAATLVFFVVVAMRDLGASDHDAGFQVLITDTADAVRHPLSSWETFTTAEDTEMFDCLATALQLIPDTLGYHPGHALYTLVTHPIPRSEWSGKPRSSEDWVNANLFGDVRAVNYDIGEPGAAYSILGGFYYDSGLIGVFAGMTLVGIVFRALWSYLNAHPANDMVMLFYAAVLPLSVDLMRGNPQLILAYGLFTAAPIVFVAFAARKPREPFSQQAASAGTAKRLGESHPILPRRGTSSGN